MTKKYKLLKELPGVPYGAIYTQENDDPNFFNTDGKSYYDRVSRYLIEGNPDWFSEIKEQERIEVQDFWFEYSPIIDGFKYCLNVSKSIPKEKFPAIKQAIEDVLNQEQEMTEALRDGIKLKTAQFKGYKFEEGKLRVPQDIAEQLRPLTPEYQKEKAATDTVVKDWEVVAYSSPYMKEEGVIFTKRGDGWFWNNEWNRYHEHQIKDCARTKIHSVKRLSDGEVFTIGDEHNGFSYHNRKIISFEIDNNEMYIKQWGGSTKLKDAKQIPPIQSRKYTQQQLDKAIEDAFWAGRTHHALAGLRYENFSDYKATLTNPSK